MHLVVAVLDRRQPERYLELLLRVLLQLILLMLQASLLVWRERLLPHFVSSAFVAGASFEVEAAVASLQLIEDVESNLWLVFATSVEGRRWFLRRVLCTCMGGM